MPTDNTPTTDTAQLDWDREKFGPMSDYAVDLDEEIEVSADTEEVGE